MRNAKDDLEICGKASPGPWRVKTNAHRATRGGSWGWIEGPRENWCWADERPRSRRDADFVATAREALPYWIERAVKLERALERAAEYVAKVTGSCPMDSELEFDLGGCGVDDCKNEFTACWKKYFKEAGE